MRIASSVLVASVAVLFFGTHASAQQQTVTIGVVMDGPIGRGGDDCQGRSKIRPRWRSKTRPSGRGSKFLTAASRGGVRKWEGPCVGGPSCCVRGDSCRR